MKREKQGMIVFAALVGFALSSQAEVLYSENFDGEGGAAAYDDGTTPEVNVGNMGVLQTTGGASQGGNGGDTAWLVAASAVNGADGLRFGTNDNWATSANSAAILAGGGFSISYDDDKNGGDSQWTCVRVGSGDENGIFNSADLTALTGFAGEMATYDDGAGSPWFGGGGTKTAYSIELKYEFDSWAADTTVKCTGYVDGQEVMTDTFTWNADNDVKIVFAANREGNLIDNIVVSSFPPPDTSRWLYSENFNGEGGAGAYDDGTTPEVNVGNMGTLTSTGSSQGGDASDTAWFINVPTTAGLNGAHGLSFGTNDNWATSANSAAILAAGGFSISYDINKNGANTDWHSMRVGSGPENGIFNSADLAVLSSFTGQMQTFDNGAGSGWFGTATNTTAVSIEAKFEFDSWDAGTTVAFTGYVDGQEVMTNTFTWEATDDVKIVFGAHKSGTTMDNIVVSLLDYELLTYSDWASSYGLTGSETNLAADLENGGLGDGLNNLAEWALDGDPTLSDAASVLQSEVDGGVLSLIYKRHLYADELGLDYTVGRDTDLVETPEGWTTNGITEASGGIDEDYEAVTNTVPADVDGRFLRLQIQQD